jgi:hypothetical protein
MVVALALGKLSFQRIGKTIIIPFNINTATIIIERIRFTAVFCLSE